MLFPVAFHSSGSVSMFLRMGDEYRMFLSKYKSLPFPFSHPMPNSTFVFHDLLSISWDCYPCVSLLCQRRVPHIRLCPPEHWPIPFPLTKCRGSDSPNGSPNISFSTFIKHFEVLVGLFSASFNRNVTSFILLPRNLLHNLPWVLSFSSSFYSCSLLVQKQCLGEESDVCWGPGVLVPSLLPPLLIALWLMAESII